MGCLGSLETSSYLLFLFYDVCLPKRTLPCQMKPDEVAIQILQKYQPVLLDTVVQFVCYR